MQFKHILAIPVAALSFVAVPAYASANLAGIVKSTVIEADTGTGTTSLLPPPICNPSPENATVLLAALGAAGLFAGYQLSRVRQMRKSSAAV